MKNCGWACCAASTSASTGSIFSTASSAGPRISNSTRPSARRARPARCGRSGRPSSFEILATTSPTAAVNAGSRRRQRAALDEDALGGRLLEAGVEDPVHAAGLARAGRVRVDGLRAGHAEREGDDDEREPAERRGLPVVGAPAAHARRQVALGGCVRTLSTPPLRRGTHAIDATSDGGAATSSAGLNRARTRRRFGLLPR